MSKTNAIVVGFITFLPIILMGVYFVWFLAFFVKMINQAGPANQPPEAFFGNMAGMMLLVGLIGLLFVGLLIYYIMHVVNNSRLDSNERIIWILVFLFAGMIGFPVYWYMRIWKFIKEQPSDSSLHS